MFSDNLVAMYPELFFVVEQWASGMKRFRMIRKPLRIWNLNAPMRVAL